MIWFFFFREELECWLDIAGYEGYYQVSNLGRLRSVKHTILMSNGLKRLIKSKILALHEGGNNQYLQAYLHKDSKVRNHLVHRLVAFHFIGPIPYGMEVNHINGKVQDNRVDNLEIVTHQANIDHSMANNLFQAKGEKHYCAKLSGVQVDEIRMRYKRGIITQRQLAEEYGVRQTSISKIINYVIRKV